MNRTETSALVVVTTSLATISIIGLGVFIWRQKKRQRIESSVEDMVIPSKWKKIGEVGELVIHPLKGGKRKCISKGFCTKVGLREDTTDFAKLCLQDRVFVVYNENKQFYNIKKNSKMLFIETTAVDECSVKFSFPDADDLSVVLPDKNENSPLPTFDLYYGDKTSTVDCGEEAAKWFSMRLLNKPTGLRLGCFVESLVPPRTTEGAYIKQIKVYPKFNSAYLGAYADIASYLLLSEESVQDLNCRLEKPITAHHFRPNIVIKGSTAYSEDSWDWIKIGDNVVLRGFKYCTRCVVTSINPDTAEKDPTFEPLQTLRTYRQVKEPELKEVEGSNPALGLYAGCHITGPVQVGDPIYINTK